MKREHVSTQPQLYRSFRMGVIDGRLHNAVLLAHSAGYRVERSDLLMPLHDAYLTLDDKLEQNAYLTQHRAAIEDAHRALQEIQRKEASGWHDVTRESEIAARLTNLAADEKARAAAVAATVAQLKKDDARALEADRLARAEQIVREGGAR